MRTAPATPSPSRTASSIESKFAAEIGDLSFLNDLNYGLDARFAHVNYISDFSNEPVSVYDLTTDPSTWAFPQTNQAAGDAVPYVSALGRIQYGTSGRDTVNAGDSVISNIYDFAAIIEHRLVFSDRLSLLIGGRYDLAHAEETDPLPLLPTAFSAYYQGTTLLPPRHNTGWYGIANGNVSPVYQFAAWGSVYLTYDYAQNMTGAAGDGGIGTYGVYEGGDKGAFQQASRLYEAGLKLNLLNKKLFWGSAVFEQNRLLLTSITAESTAKIFGIETELDYQPTGNMFLTASYSHVRHATQRAGRIL